MQMITAQIHDDCSSDTLGLLCQAYAGPHDIVQNITKAVCKLFRPKQLLHGITPKPQHKIGERRRRRPKHHRVDTPQESGSEMRNLELMYTSYLQTDEVIIISKNKLKGQMQLAMCWSGSSHLHEWKKNSNCL